MNMLLAQNPDVYITAHRGASGLAPENTLAAIKKAMELGAQYSEIDVQETADGKIILLHDDNLKRTAGVNKNIWEIKFDDLKFLDVGSWFDQEFKNEPVPTLESVIDLVKGRMKLNIELKTNGFQVALAERVVKIITEKNFISDCILTSFNFSEVEKVQTIDSDIKYGYIFSKMPDSNIFDAPGKVLSVNRKLIDHQFLEKAHQAKKEVHVWTVNDTREMSRLIDMGVDNIITNYPDRLYHVVYQKDFRK
jgi:glycerophosphoryl diester phosphodiesterase